MGWTILGIACGVFLAALFVGIWNELITSFPIGF